MIDSFLSSVRRPGLFVFALACAVRAAIAVAVPHAFFHSGGDVSFFERIARFLSTGHGFGGLQYVAPGFPVLFTGARMISGAAMPIFALRIANVLIGSAAAFGAFLLGETLFNRKIGMIAGIFAALYPVAALEIFTFSPDLLYSCLFLFSVICFLKASYAACQSGAGMSLSLPLFLISGLLAASAALTDPIGLYVPALLLVWHGCMSLRDYASTNRERRGAVARRAFAGAAVFACGCLLLLGPWFLRNVRVAPEPKYAPFIQKRVEKDFFTDPRSAEYILQAFALPHIAASGEKAAQIVLIPFNLFLLDSGTPVSYKAEARNFFHGQRNGSRRIFVIMISKIIILFLHAAIVLAAFWEMARARQARRAALLVVLILGYVLFSVIGYGRVLHFNISPISGFFYPLMPFFFAFAAAFFVRREEALRSR